MEKKIDKQTTRLKKYKADHGLTYPELAKIFGVKDKQYAYAFVSGERRLSRAAAQNIEKKTGWRAAYWKGEDDFKTDAEIRDSYREVPLAKEEAYINAWNILLHEIAETNGYTLNFDGAGDKLTCSFSGASVSFDDFRQDMLDYAKFYIDKIIKRGGEQK